MVLILLDGKRICGGTIIALDRILTAAHCVDGASELVVYAGDICISKIPPDHHINIHSQQKILATASNVYIHPDYYPLSSTADLAIIILPESFDDTAYARPIKLGDLNKNDVGNLANITGYGFISDNDITSSSLRKIPGYIISNDECKKTYDDNVNNGKVCIRIINGMNTNIGDSGSPLTTMVNGIRMLIGIVIAGGRSSNDPVLCSRTAFHIKWIFSTLPSRRREMNKSGRLKHPYTVLIQSIKENDKHCGGSLIAPDMILTAASCVNRFQHSFRVLAGDLSSKNSIVHPSKDVRVVKISAVTLNPNWTATNVMADLAILTVSTPFKITDTIDFIAMDSFTQKIDKHIEEKATFAGYGWASQSTNRYVVRSFQEISDLTITENLDCIVGSNENINVDSMICLNTKGTNHPCIEDGGSPLTIIEGEKHLLIGISRNIDCSAVSTTDVFTRVAFHREWIESILHPPYSHTKIDPKKYSHMVLIERLDEADVCAGTIIAFDKILTAGSCLYGIDNFVVYVGVTDIYTSPREKRIINSNLQQELNSTDVKFHPDFNYFNSVADLAIITLRKPLEKTEYTNVIQLDNNYQVKKTHVGKQASISSYGFILNEDNKAVDFLQDINGIVLNDEKCLEFFTPITGDTICIDTPNDETCNGEFGDPLTRMVHGVLVQIGISGWESCPKDYTVRYFTRISYYRDWIDSIINPNAQDTHDGLKYPYMALIQVANDGPFFSGSIIAPNMILTTAHKFAGITMFTIHVGVTSISSDQTTITSTQNIDASSVRVRRHPNYNSKTFDSNLAIVILETPLQMTDKINTIALYYYSNDLDKHENELTTFTSYDYWIGYSSLHKVKGVVVKHATCEKELKHLAKETICIKIIDNTEKCFLTESGILTKTVDGIRAQIGIARLSSCLVGRQILSTNLGYYRDWIDGMIPSTTPNAAAEINGRKHPYMVLLGYKNFCGGALIAPNMILTAAHCLDYVGQVMIRVGCIKIKNLDVFSNKSGDPIEQSNILIHPNYNSSSLIANLAILVLYGEPFPMTECIGTIGLDDQSDDPDNHKDDLVTMTGYVYNGNVSSLREINGTVLADTICNKNYPNRHDRKCFSSYKGNTCINDAGSPLTTIINNKRVLIGIVSKAKCADNNVVLYTRIAPYRKWIDEKIKERIRGKEKDEMRQIV